MRKGGIFVELWYFLWHLLGYKMGAQMGGVRMVPIAYATRAVVTTLTMPCKVVCFVVATQVMAKTVAIAMMSIPVLC